MNKTSSVKLTSKKVSLLERILVNIHYIKNIILELHILNHIFAQLLNIVH